MEKDIINKLTLALRGLAYLGCQRVMIPCNTVHYWFDTIKKVAQEVDIQVVNLIEETGRYINVHFPEQESVLLLSTLGTLKANVYQTYFKAFNLDVIIPTASEQEMIMNLVAKTFAIGLDCQC